MKKLSKVLGTVLTLAVCLMGILPICVCADTPYPKPYYDTPYVLGNTINAETICLFTDSGLDDLQSYRPTGCYTKQTTLYGYKLTNDGITDVQNEISITNFQAYRDPITWIGTTYAKSQEGSYSEYFISFYGYVNDVNIVNGSQYRDSYVLYSVMGYEDRENNYHNIQMGIAFSHELTSEYIGYPTISSWYSYGADCYVLYVDSSSDGSIGINPNMQFWFKSWFSLYYPNTPERTDIPEVFVLTIQEFCNIITNGYGVIVDVFVDKIPTYISILNPIMLIPLFLFGTVCILLCFILIKKLFRR